MQDKIFDREMQEKMRNFFIDNLIDKGVIKYYKKNSLISTPTSEYIAIVVDGKVKQSIINENGASKLLYILQRGEVIGEVDYFGGGDINSTSIAMTDTCISIINKENLEKALENNPEIYRYFLYSSSRKFRIIMLQLKSLAFSDSLSALSNQILRLYIQQGMKINGKNIIDISLTHQEIAELMGVSRVTVTRGLNMLKEKNIIDIEDKKIVIINMKKLEKLSL
ncbi:Crp/Fnr family transcriptional regulator [Senegalia massiliensis]|uniref:Crp/Fnr family transcriptional regulator n=1 Tax=Senegalia massiliensis TaxID=1720316 RepID=UPI0010317B03|nr:Crp/Fnr family transcriptional regulator [Senegalia massiliensis]